MRGCVGWLWALGVGGKVREKLLYFPQATLDGKV